MPKILCAFALVVVASACQNEVEKSIEKRAATMQEHQQLAKAGYEGIEKRLDDGVEQLVTTLQEHSFRGGLISPHDQHPNVVAAVKLAKKLHADLGSRCMDVDIQVDSSSLPIHECDTQLRFSSQGHPFEKTGVTASFGSIEQGGNSYNGISVEREAELPHGKLFIRLYI